MRLTWKRIGRGLAIQALAFSCLVTGISLGGSPVEARGNETAAGSEFLDVAGHWASRQIGEGVASGLLRGFPDGTFRPDQAITQEEFLVMVERVIPSFSGRDPARMDGQDYLSKAKGRWSEKTYAHLLSAGILASGMPSEPLTRLEGARILLAALGQQSEGERYRGTKVRFFPDLPVENERQVMVAYPAYKLGLMTGYPDGTFRAGESVSRAQAVVLALRLQEKIKELFPGDVTDQEKEKMTRAVAGFVENVMGKEGIRRYEDLLRYVKERKLPVSEQFLREHFSFLKYDLYHAPRFPQFDELIYYARIGSGKYRMTVQYYAGEAGGSMDRTFYLASTDGKTFRLIGKDE